jgi:hypothetical protein
MIWASDAKCWGEGVVLIWEKSLSQMPYYIILLSNIKIDVNKDHFMCFLEVLWINALINSTVFK